MNNQTKLFNPYYCTLLPAHPSKGPEHNMCSCRLMARFVKGAGRNKAQYSFFRISARCQLGNSDGRVGNDHITLPPWASMATFQCVFFWSPPW